jgi:hypothetical protein
VSTEGTQSKDLGTLTATGIRQFFKALAADGRTVLVSRVLFQWQAALIPSASMHKQPACHVDSLPGHETRFL